MIVHHTASVSIYVNAVDRTVSLRNISFFRKSEWIVEEPFLTNKRPALNGKRSANSIDSFFECREYQGVAAIDNLIIDRHYGYDLRRTPVTTSKYQLRRNECTTVTVRCNNDLSFDVLLCLVCRSVTDCQHSSTNQNIIKADQVQIILDLFQQAVSHCREIIAKLSFVAGNRLESIAADRDVTEFQRPCLSCPDLACKLDLDEFEIIITVTGNLNGHPAGRLSYYFTAIHHSNGKFGVERRCRFDEQLWCLCTNTDC